MSQWENNDMSSFSRIIVESGTDVYGPPHEVGQKTAHRMTINALLSNIPGGQIH